MAQTPRNSGVFSLGALSADNAFEAPSLDLNFDGQASSFTRATTDPTAAKANGDQLATSIVTQNKGGSVQSLYMGPHGKLVNGHVTNLLPHSTDFSTSAGWTHGISPSLTTGQADPFGGTNATTIGDTSSTQFSSIAYGPTSGNDLVLTASIFIEKQSNTITDQVCLLRLLTGPTLGLFDLQIKPQDGSYSLIDKQAVNPDILEATREDFGDWWRFSVTAGHPNYTPNSYEFHFFPDVGTSFVAPGSTYDSAGTGAVTIFGAQFEVAGSPSQYVASTAQVPRLEYDASGNPLGLLVEEARTNLLTKSSDLTHSDWVALNGISITDGKDDPAGGTGAFLVEDGNQTAYSLFRQDATVATTGGTYTASIFVKKTAAAGSEFRLQFRGVGETAADVRLDTYTGQISGGSADVQDYNGWWRISTTTTLVSTTTLRFAVYPAIAASFGGVDDVSAQTTAGTHIVYGPQIEEGEATTSYIPTDTTTEARAADDITLATSSFGFDNTASSVAMSVNGLRDDTNQRLLSMRDSGNTSTERADLLHTPSNQMQQYVRNASGAQVSQNIVGVTGQSSRTVAATIQQDNYRLSMDGSSPIADTSAAVPTINEFRLGAGINSPLNGHIRRLTYWPRALSDASLASYTGTTPPTTDIDRPTRRWGGMTGRSLVASGNVPTTGVLSLPELLQARYGVGASSFIGATFDALIIGGGGGGGLNQFTAFRDTGGGGGAEVAALTSQTLSAASYSITIGGGGTKQTSVSSSTPKAGDGGRTTFFGTTVKGGGGGFGHALASPYKWSASYSPAVQGGGGSSTSAGNLATGGYTHAGNYHSTPSAGAALPGHHGGGASGPVPNIGTAPTAPGPGTSSSITGSAVEYGIGGWGGYGTGYPDHTDFGCGGRGDGRTNTTGGDGLSGAVILRVFNQLRTQSEVEAMITSATNLTVSVAADGADTVVTFEPTTKTTTASCTFTPA